MFDDAFIDNLPDDPADALSTILEHFFIKHIENQKIQKFQIEDYVTAYSLLESFLESRGIEVDTNHLNETNIQKIDHIVNSFKLAKDNIYSNLHNKKLMRLRGEFKEKFAFKLGKTFAYEFSEGDLKIIQMRINELRDLITNEKNFEENHRGRLLNRLERLQSELHKRVSDLDRFWGFIGDAGVVMGKFGKDAKPIVDRIREIVEIVWRTQGRAEELESGAHNLLLNPKDDENKPNFPLPT